MNVLTKFLLLGWLACLPLMADNLKPVADGPAGQRAFDELAQYYAGKSTSDTATALADLNGPDPVKAQAAGQYFLALFEQTLADEKNGRTEWKEIPVWGGGSENKARTLRGTIAHAFGDSANSNDAFPAMLWLIHTEPVEESIEQGAKVLPRLYGSAADAELDRIITQPHPSEAVLLLALDTISRRRLGDESGKIAALGHSYRGAVREACRAALADMGQPPLTDQPVVEFPPRMVELLKRNGERLLSPAPDQGIWIDGEGRNAAVHGWLMDDGLVQVRALDYFAREKSYLKIFSKFHTGTLEETADAMIAQRAELTRLLAAPEGKKEEIEKLRGGLSLNGSLSAQFEPSFISLPEITVSYWLWQKGDTGRCQRMLAPCYAMTQDDRWIDLASRDYLGNVYFQRMVRAYCTDEDDVEALGYAQHLVKPIFDGFAQQDVAKELAAQLGRDDNQGLSLPVFPVWMALQLTMSREEQIAYLGKRLRLLHTEQMTQPGDVSYSSQVPYSFAALYCINPYLELKRMGLTGRDLEALAPYTTDQDFMQTYSYARDFAPGRTLHRVSWAVRQLVNEAAGSELLAKNENGTVVFKTKPEGSVVDELKAWSQAQPPRPDWMKYYQTPVAVAICAGLLYLWLRFPPKAKPPRMSLVGKFRQWRRSRPR